MIRACRETGWDYFKPVEFERLLNSPPQRIMKPDELSRKLFAVMAASVAVWIIAAILLSR